MDKQSKSLTISELVKTLENLKLKFGDKEVVLSSDPEGNSFGTLDRAVGVAEFYNNHIILYPTEQFTGFRGEE